MTSDLPASDAWDQQLADARRRVENCRESIVNATKAAATDPQFVRSFPRYPRQKQLEMIIAAREIHDLGLLAPIRPGPTLEEVHEHELRLGLPPGTFSRSVYDPGTAQAVQLGRALELAQELAEAQLSADDPAVTGSKYLPAIIRICCATVVGTLIGAPLGALAVEESILRKMYEAAIVTGISSVAAELAGPLSEMAARPRPQTEIAPEERAVVAVQLLPDAGHNELPDPVDTPPAPEPAEPESLQAEVLEVVPSKLEPAAVERLEAEPEPDPSDLSVLELSQPQLLSPEPEMVESEPAQVERPGREPVNPEPPEAELEEFEPFPEL